VSLGPLLPSGSGSAPWSWCGPCFHTRATGQYFPHRRPFCQPACRTAAAEAARVRDLPVRHQRPRHPGAVPDVRRCRLGTHSAWSRPRGGLRAHTAL